MTRKTILIVDDDRDLLLGLGIRLRAAGYQVTIARDTSEAIRAAITTEPDLVLLDLGLPGGDGLGVLARLKGTPSLSEIPVIVVTARDISYEERSLEAGAAAFLQKPVDNEDLFARIALTLEASDHAARG